jgi:hypothetical protein
MSERWRWRPEPWWVLAGAWWGAVGGSAATFVGYLLVAAVGDVYSDGPTTLVASAVVVGVLGGMAGGVVGLLVGVVLMLAVGRDRDVRQARRIAAVTALVAAPAITAGLFWQAVHWSPWTCWPALVAAVLAPPFAVWTAGAMPGRPRLAARAERRAARRR